MKYIFLFISIIILSILITCTFVDNSSTSIEDCFSIKKEQYSLPRVKSYVLGEWSIDDSLSLLFNHDNKLYLLNDKVILQAGEYNIKKNSDQYYIESNILDYYGILYICGEQIQIGIKPLKYICSCQIH